MNVGPDGGGVDPEGAGCVLPDDGFGVLFGGEAGLLLPSIPGGNCTLSIRGVFSWSGRVSPGFFSEGGAAAAV